jgi:hypothetical protein
MLMVEGRMAMKDRRKEINKGERMDGRMGLKDRAYGGRKRGRDQ